MPLRCGDPIRSSNTRSIASDIQEGQTPVPRVIQGQHCPFVCSFGRNVAALRKRRREPDQASSGEIITSQKSEGVEGIEPRPQLVSGIGREKAPKTGSDAGRIRVVEQPLEKSSGGLRRGCARGG